MWCYKTFVVFFVAQIIGGSGEDQTTIFLGGIFEDFSDSETNSNITDEQAFQYAIDINNLLLREYGVTYAGLTEETFNHREGPYKVTQVTCALIKRQALVIFGPKEVEQIEAAQSICDYKDMAHVITRWMYSSPDHRSIINFYPHSDELSAAYFSIVKMAGWKSFTLFYEDNESLLRLGTLLNLAKNEKIIVSVKQLDEGAGNYRKTLKEAVHSGQRNYVIDCKTEILEEVLTQVQQVGMMTSQYNFFITNLDLHTINLESFRYSEANITGIRIFDLESEYTNLTQTIFKKDNTSFDVNKMRTETALLFDAISVIAKVISTKLSLQEMDLNDDSCDSLKSSRHGYTISNTVKTSKNNGMTGLIEFDGNGFRSNFNLDIIEIREKDIVKVGTWNVSKGLTTVQPQSEGQDDDEFSLRNKTFIVITCLTDPYCMLKESSEQLFNNDRFEGFAIDLIAALAAMEGFNYTFIIREDKANGAKKNGTWDGMIGDVIDHKADLAITDLTITSEREEAVDFTSPFMNLGISILAKKPQNAPPGFFSFADPFALDTWVGLALAYAVVTISFFILGRLSQDEWTNPYPCIEEPEFLINQFSFSNSAWFAVGALMQQGTEIAPIGVSTRMLTGMWWFFVLIMVSSYTASLAAFLATENPIHLFTDVESLVNNRENFDPPIRMGAKKEGATESFFKGKDNKIYQKIADYMATHREDMVGDNKDGVKLAENSTYAFFMESISIEYEIQRHCDLQQYGKLLDDKGYGIAMRKNSTYRTKLSTAILKLQSSGELDKLKRKWWEEQRGGGQCTGGDDDGSTPPLGVQNVVGVFYVVIIGTIFAVFLVIVEFLLKIRKISKRVKMSFKEVLKIEIKAFMDFNSNVKPTVRPKSKSGSKASHETGTSNNNQMPSPAPYGFIPTITKDELNE